MRCDVIAEGIIAAANQLDLGIPIVVRLQGRSETFVGYFCLFSWVFLLTMLERL